ncbi:MAG: CotH kinase family protein, partial [Planctomycetes bacterium]|nr:CotH kinase family protein [Planctomycetota bacterium]
AGPTPGAPNSVLTTEIPPHLRQVAHLPEMPATGGLVLVTAKATDDDGVAEVFLEYQLVDPGAYIRLSDPDYQTQWARIDMNDAGLEGDAEASDDIFTALMPEALQVHRRLVRYRITAVDARGHSVTAPFPEDPQPNFAYFVYDGAPSWQGSARPGVLPVQTYGPALLESIPVYHFLTRREDRLNAIHVPYRWGASGQMTPTGGEYWGSDYLWQGTLVYDGRVYDHIRYRARGGVWRYSMGKNMWKFDFNRGHSFEARDDYGRRYDADWDKLNFSAIIQQGNFLQRGEQGLFEGAGFRLHNLVGNATSLTHFVHFRLIEAADENGPDQYSGDFQGLYLVLEQLDGRFLDQHRLPDGNLYKMEGGTGELNNQGPDQPKDKSDLNSFMSTYQSTSPAIQWWRDNLDLEDYYGFRAIATVIHDYDIHAGKNYFYFNNPVTRKWQVFNWDLDLTWTTTYGGGGLTGPLSPYTIDRFPELMLEYRNRMREIRDLLFNPEQTGMLLDEVAGVVYRAGELSFVDADRAMWDYNPILVSSYVRSDKAGHGKYYEAAPGRTFASMLQYQKNYVTSRGSWLDSNIANDSSIPQRPSVTFQGATGFPIDDLRFRASAFSDPQGSGTFGAMKWRLAEVTPPGAPPFDPLHPKKYEIEADWESDVLTVYERDIQIPREVPVIGRTYRVRVRMMDSTNRWSRWSDPVEFVAGAPLEPFPAESHLRITEVMYHPSQGADYEFVELQNIGPEAIDLSSVAFTEGIEFEFSGGAVTELGPGEFVLVVENEAVFRSTYDAADLLIAGEYSGRLANEGERIALVAGASSTVLDFTFSDDWYPATDGGGYSLVSADPLDAPEVWGLAIGWRESSEVGGSPGWADGSTPPGGRQRPGDGNQDGEVDLSDAIALLLHLFRGGRPLPCEGGSISEGGNLQLFDVNGDARVDVSDAIFTLQYVFLDGAPPALGTACVRIEGCPSACF